MNFKNLFNTDDRAVSPVIGVILMVAITVILAAVIGTFVLGLGDSVSDTSPQASLSFEFSDTDTSPDGNADEFTVTHEGGDPIPDTAQYTIDGGTAQDFDSELTVGSSVTFDDSSIDIEDGETVRIIVDGRVVASATYNA